MNKYLISIALFLPFYSLNAQQTVKFLSSDGVTITADHYVISTQKPYIILLHQAGYSRGEYKEIAPKLANLGFNCLAVDLRSGGEVNFQKNLTAQDALSKGLPCSYLDSRPDIKSAIEYVASRTKKPIILWGSSYSASLALIEATENFKIKAVVAFSPGDYFNNQFDFKKSIQQTSVPVIALFSKSEYNSLVKQIDQIPSKYLISFKPSSGEGSHGSSALWEKNPNNQEYWMAITQFFSNLKLK